MNLSREELYNRHRLSHQQINDLRGEQQHELLLEEKVSQLKQISLFLKITTALRQEGIWFVSYKGPLLSYRIYNDATCRRFKDLDFLIRPCDVRRTIDVLSRFGFAPRSFQWTDSHSKEKRLLLLLNQFTLENQSQEVSIEIHWSLLKFPVARQKKLAALVDENIITTVFAGRQFNQFTIEFELLHLVIHGGLHTWSRLKWLIDVHEILKRFSIDKTKFETLVKQLHAERMVGLCNAMLKYYFPGTALLPIESQAPAWFIKYSLHQMMRTSDSPVYLPEDLFTYRWFHIHAFPRLRYRLMKVFMLLVFFLQNEKKKLFHRKPVRLVN